MHTIIKDVMFSASAPMQRALVKKLNFFGIYMIGQLADHNNYELFKIRGLGMGKFALVQNAMMKHGVIFQNGYIKLAPKYGDKHLQKHGVQI